jgi:hypothetical protein
VDDRAAELLAEIFKNPSGQSIVRVVDPSVESSGFAYGPFPDAEALLVLEKARSDLAEVGLTDQIVELVPWAEWHPS